MISLSLKEIFHGTMAKLPEYRLKVRKFKLQSHYYIHF